MGLREAPVSPPFLLVSDSKKRFVRETYEIRDNRGFVRTVPWDFLDTPASVLVIPMLTPQILVMVRQYRPSLHRFALELPAGGVDPGQDVEDAARNELKTETGYIAGEFRKIGEYYVLPSETNRYINIFLAPNIQWCEEPQHDRDQEADLELAVAQVFVDDLYSCLSNSTPVRPLKMFVDGKPVVPTEMVVDGLETIAALLLARPAMGDLGSVPR